MQPPPRGPPERGTSLPHCPRLPPTGRPVRHMVDNKAPALLVPSTPLPQQEGGGEGAHLLPLLFPLLPTRLTRWRRAVVATHHAQTRVAGGVRKAGQEKKGGAGTTRGGRRARQMGSGRAPTPTAAAAVHCDRAKRGSTTLGGSPCQTGAPTPSPPPPPPPPGREGANRLVTRSGAPPWWGSDTARGGGDPAAGRPPPHLPPARPPSERALVHTGGWVRAGDCAGAAARRAAMVSEAWMGEGGRPCAAGGPHRTTAPPPMSVIMMDGDVGPRAPRTRL